MTRSTLVLLVVSVLTGCGGGGGSSEPQKLFTAADATRIASVPPAASGWTWPENPEHEPFSDESPADATDPLLVEFLEQTADLDDLGEVANRWRDDDKLANVSVGIYGTAADARDAMAAFNALSRGWGEQLGEVTKEEDVEALADEAWLLEVAGNGTQVTYHVRRDNLVLEAHLHCYGSCPDDVEDAARQWIDAIDEEARGGS